MPQHDEERHLLYKSWQNFNFSLFFFFPITMPRKVAYSGKKKREQLRERNERKREKGELNNSEIFDRLLT